MIYLFILGLSMVIVGVHRCFYVPRKMYDHAMLNAAVWEDISEGWLRLFWEESEKLSKYQRKRDEKGRFVS